VTENRSHGRNQGLNIGFAGLKKGVGWDARATGLNATFMIENTKVRLAER